MTIKPHRDVYALSPVQQVILTVLILHDEDIARPYDPRQAGTYEEECDAFEVLDSLTEDVERALYQREIIVADRRDTTL